MPSNSTVTLLQDWTDQAINTVGISTAQTLAGSGNVVTAFFVIEIAPIATTAPATGTTDVPGYITIEGTPETSGDSAWSPLLSIGLNRTAAVTDTVSVTATAGSTSITTSGTSGALGARSQFLYFRESSSSGQIVWAQSHSSSTLLIPSPGLVQTANSGTSIFTQAVRSNGLVDVSNVKRLRVVRDNNRQASGPGFASRVRYMTFTTP